MSDVRCLKLAAHFNHHNCPFNCEFMRSDVRCLKLAAHFNHHNCHCDCAYDCGVWCMACDVGSCVATLTLLKWKSDVILLFNKRLLLWILILFYLYRDQSILDSCCYLLYVLKTFYKIIWGKVPCCEITVFFQFWAQASWSANGPAVILLGVFFLDGSDWQYRPSLCT